MSVEVLDVLDGICLSCGQGPVIIDGSGHGSFSFWAYCDSCNHCGCHGSTPVEVKALWDNSHIMVFGVVQTPSTFYKVDDEWSDHIKSEFIAADGERWHPLTFLKLCRSFVDRQLLLADDGLRDEVSDTDWELYFHEDLIFRLSRECTSLLEVV